MKNEPIPRAIINIKILAEIGSDNLSGTTSGLFDNEKTM